MKLIQYLILLTFSFGFLYKCDFGISNKHGLEPPNIILILADDLGWKDVGFMGNEIIETPNLDYLARQGVIFNQAYANAPNCAPTRACLMSGKYGPWHGVYTVNSSKRGKSENRKLIPIENTKVLDSAFVTIPEVLKTRGYITASIGKWHLGANPTIQGFDFNIAGTPKGHPKSYFSPYQNKNLEDGATGEHLTDRLTNEAIAFIGKNKSKPFFLYLPYYAVHTPFQAKVHLIKKYREKIDSTSHLNPVYAAMVETMDANIGRLHQVLDSLNLDENTILIFTSDNGNHQNASSAAPLRGSKGMLYEGGIRVPFFIHQKGVFEKSIREEPITTIDIFPTILEMVNHTFELCTFQPNLPPIDIEQLKLDGKGFFNLLYNHPPTFEERALFWHFPAYLEGYRGAKQLWRQTPASAIRLGDWKLIETFETGELELYHLAADIGEIKNLVKENPDKTKELYDALKNWRAEVNAPVPTTKNPDYKE